MLAGTFWFKLNGSNCSKLKYLYSIFVNEVRYGGKGETRNRRRGPLIAAGILLGLGLRFVDGILHQILQWHHMLSSVLACPHCLRLRAKYGGTVCLMPALGC